MKKLFTFVAAALVSASAFAQAHCKWTVEQLPQQAFATVDDAVAAGYVTMWGQPGYLGMPACDLINSANIKVSLPLDYNYVSVGNGKYSGKDYYKATFAEECTGRDYRLAQTIRTPGFTRSSVHYAPDLVYAKTGYQPCKWLTDDLGRDEINSALPP